MKKFTARQIIKSIQTEPESRRDWLLERMEVNAQKIRLRNNQQYQLWQYDNHPIALWSPKVIWQNLFRNIAEKSITSTTIQFGRVTFTKPNIGCILAH